MLFHTSNPASHTSAASGEVATATKFKGERNGHRMLTGTPSNAVHTVTRLHITVVTSALPRVGYRVSAIADSKHRSKLPREARRRFPVVSAVLLQVYCFTYSLTSFPRSWYPRDVDVGVDIARRPAWTRWRTSRAFSSWRTRKKS